MKRELVNVSLLVAGLVLAGSVLAQQTIDHGKIEFEKSCAAMPWHGWQRQWTAGKSAAAQRAGSHVAGPEEPGSAAHEPPV